MLDKWSFDKFYELFEKIKTDSALSAKVNADQAIFFLHLLGVDSNGHTYRPHSKEFVFLIKGALCIELRQSSPH